METKFRLQARAPGATRVIRILAAGLAALTLSSCGGGGDDDSPTTPVPANTVRAGRGWIALDWTSAPSGVTDQNFVNVDGRAFMAAKSVLWTNKTTGETKETEHRLGCSGGFFVLCEHAWHAEVRLVQGPNVVQFTASDDAGNFESETFTFTWHDTVPPKVLSTGPKSGATGIAVDSLITVVFSELMDSSTVNSATLKLEDSAGNPVAAVVTSSSGFASGVYSDLATLDPLAPLAGSTVYRASVTTEARDLF